MTAGGATLASQTVNNRGLNLLEIGVSGLFGGIGLSWEVGAGWQGAVRGFFAGGGLSILERLVNERINRGSNQLSVAGFGFPGGANK